MLIELAFRDETGIFSDIINVGPVFFKKVEFDMGLSNAWIILDDLPSEPVERKSWPKRDKSAR